MAQEDQAGDVLEGSPSASARSRSAHEGAGVGDRGVVMAATGHDLAHSLGVAALGRVAPGEIARPAVGIIAAGREPALDMLSAHRDLQGFGSARREGGQRLAHPPPVGELGRPAGLKVRVARIRRVDGAQRALQSIGHGEWAPRCRCSFARAQTEKKAFPPPQPSS